MKKFVALLLFITFTQHVYSEDSRKFIKIGGLFDEQTDDVELAFKYAINRANEQSNNSTNFEAHTMRVEYGNQFETSKKLCRMLRDGIFAVLGPSSTDSSSHLQSICDDKEIPVIETRFEASPDATSVNLHPHPAVLEEAIIDLIDALEWKNFTLLIENRAWMPYIGKILKANEAHKYSISLKDLGDGVRTGYFFQTLKRAVSDDNKKFIIFSSIEFLSEIFDQAQQVGLMTKNQEYIVTSLDFHTIDLSRYHHSGVKITGFRLIDPDSELVQKVTGFFRSSHEAPIQYGKKVSAPEKWEAEKLQVDTALAYDSVLLLTKVLEQEDSLQPRITRCDYDSSKFEIGSSLINALKYEQFEGLSGRIEFDRQGHRTLFSLDIVEMNDGGIKKIGKWNSTTGLALQSYRRKDEKTLNIREETFTILTIINPPYTVLRESDTRIESDDALDGFAVDLIKELANMLGFKYKFKLQEDNTYGSYNIDTDSWSGMIGEIIEERADLAITDLTITSNRQSAVDFSSPFMQVGISILYKKSKPEKTYFPYFTTPFTGEVWMYTGISFLVVSFVLAVVGHLSPQEWGKCHCMKKPKYLENQFSLKNSLWFVYSALFRQGSEVVPKSIATRIVASVWWLFSLIMFIVYIAKLISLFINYSPYIETYHTPFRNVEELFRQEDIVLGAKHGGSTLNFFRDSDNYLYQQIYEKMVNSSNESLVFSNDDAVDKVKNENFAYFMESSTIDYLISRECDLTRIGGMLDSKFYGIAMKKGNPYRDAISAAIIKLQEYGKIHELKHKWWYEKLGGNQCSVSGTDEIHRGRYELSIDDVWGVFAVLIVGCILAIIITFLYLCYDNQKRAAEHKVSCCTVFGSYLKSCCSNKKPIVKQTKRPIAKESEKSSKKLLDRPLSIEEIEENISI